MASYTVEPELEHFEDFAGAATVGIAGISSADRPNAGKARADRKICDAVSVHAIGIRPDVPDLGDGYVGDADRALRR